MYILLLYTDCYINLKLDLESCSSYDVEGVEIEISPFGTIRDHVIKKMHPHICHPMKCIEGKQPDRIVSIIAKAIGGVADGVTLTTQPAEFYPGDRFYTHERDCYNGPADVNVTCQSALLAGFYSLGNYMLLSTVIVDMQLNGLYVADN